MGGLVQTCTWTLWLRCTVTRSDVSEVEQGAEHGFVLTGLDVAPGPGLVIGVRLNPV